jgi:hypothetical protein
LFEEQDRCGIDRKDLQNTVEKDAKEIVSVEIMEGGVHDRLDLVQSLLGGG